MELRKKTFALLLAAILLMLAAAPAWAQPTEGSSQTFTVTVNLPEALEGRSDITVLSGAMVQLIACYDGQYQAPAGTQFCWQYSTSGEADSFNYLSPAPDDSSHISTNAVNVTAGAGTLWYRVVLENSDHQLDSSFRPNVSSVAVVRRADFLFTQPAADPQPVTALPGAQVELGPVLAENVRGAAVRYQWQQQEEAETWRDLDGAAAPTLQTGPLSPGTYHFRCKATVDGKEDMPAIYSPVYTVEVAPLAVAGYDLQVSGENVDLPDDNTAVLPAGETAALTAVLTEAFQAASYQWQYAEPGGGWYDLGAGSGVWGCQAATLNVPITAQTDGRRYRCKIVTADAVLGTDPGDPVVTLRTHNPGADYAGIVPSPFIACEQVNSVATEIAAPLGMPLVIQAVNRSAVEIPEQYLAWQWESASSQDGTFSAISGTQESFCVISPPANGAVYLRCRVANTAAPDGAWAVSNTLSLRALPPDGSVYFTEPLHAPEPAAAEAGSSYTFTAQARTDDGTPVHYAWQYAQVAAASTAVENVPDTAWTNLAGAESSVYTAENLRPGHYFYRCVAANAEDPRQQALSVASKLSVAAPATKPVVSPPELITDADGLSVPCYVPVGTSVGGETTFQVKAEVSSGDRLDYNWYLLPSGPNATPELLADADTDTLVLRDIPARYDACSFFCIVSNRSNRTEQTRSGAFYLSVWPAGREPEILAEPQDISADYVPGTVEGSLTVAVTAAGSTGAVVEKRSADGTFAPSKIIQLKKAGADGTENEDPASQTYSATIPLNAGSFALNGTYRIRVENGTAAAPGLAPYALTAPFDIFVSVSGQPYFAAEPQPAEAAAGRSATFTAEASATPTAPITYCWQISEDGGSSYRNCLPQDGTAADGTFTTVVLTDEMETVEPKLQFRCLAANVLTGQSALSAGAQLTILPDEAPPVTGDPQITVAAGSSLQIEAGFVSGLTVSPAGAQADAFLSQLAGPDGYHLTLKAADGQDTAETPVSTGMLVELVRDTDSAEIPETLTVVVRGDVTGTGRLSIAQVTAIAKAINGQKPLDGAYLVAGDLNGNGSIDVADLVSEAKLLNNAE